MRQLKTPEEIIKDAGYDKLFWNDVYHRLIIATQRDALECALENVSLTTGGKEYSHANTDLSIDTEIDESSILNLMPKEI